ncbi:MAG: hypothetical protein LBE20_04260 [Deltaproteobacteria bacterium]|jgi:hypothetical protein|nr:hypothetical protein [Deltaproteobacteria bacterium]
MKQVVLNKCSESGSALIFAIAISALTATILFLLTTVLNHQITVASALNYKLNTEIETQKQLTTLANSLTTETSVSAPAIANHLLATKIFKFQVQNSQLTKVKRENNLFLLPDWSSLKLLPNIICPLHNPTPQNKNQSIRTCLFHETEITYSSYFNGNLQANSLSLSQLSEQKIIIVSLGEIEIESLKLKNLENITLEFIAVGKISIHSILASNSKNIALFATSSNGDISIATHDIINFYPYQTSTEYFGKNLTIGRSS